MESKIIARVASKFILGGGSGVVAGIITFDIFIKFGMNPTICNLIGYGVGACINFSVQWWLRNFNVKS